MQLIDALKETTLKVLPFVKLLEHETKINPIVSADSEGFYANLQLASMYYVFEGPVKNRQLKLTKDAGISSVIVELIDNIEEPQRYRAVLKHAFDLAAFNDGEEDSYSVSCYKQHLANDILRFLGCSLPFNANYSLNGDELSLVNPVTIESKTLNASIDVNVVFMPINDTEFNIVIDTMKLKSPALKPDDDICVAIRLKLDLIAKQFPFLKEKGFKTEFNLARIGGLYGIYIPTPLSIQNDTAEMKALFAECGYNVILPEGF